MQQQNSQNDNPLSTVIGIVLMIVLFIGLFYVARFIYRILLAVAPILFIITFFMDRRVIINYVKWLGTLVRRNTVTGIGAILLSVVGFPIVSVFLFGRALLNRKMKEHADEARERREGKLIEYEELDSEPLVPTRAKEKEAPLERNNDDEYTDLFNK